MTNLIVVAVLVVIVVGAVAVYLAMRGPGAATYKVSGYVKTEGTALPDATVTIDGKSAVTDSNGYYEITGLEGNKSYTLSVSKNNYTSTSVAVSVGSQDAQVSDIGLKAGTTLPLTAIKSALATLAHASADNVDICFCDIAAQTDNYAVGAVVNRQKSYVFFYQESTSGITVENEYTATGAALTAMATITLKNVTSRFTSYNKINKIVPFDISQKGAAYSFNYFDGYDGILQRWGFGTANLDNNQDIPDNMMTHSWI